MSYLWPFQILVKFAVEFFLLYTSSSTKSTFKACTCEEMSNTTCHLQSPVFYHTAKAESTGFNDVNLYGKNVCSYTLGSLINF